MPHPADPILWRLNLAAAITHAILLIYVPVSIFDAPSFDTYNLHVPRNGTAHVTNTMQFNVQAALCAVHAVTAISHLVCVIFEPLYVRSMDNYNSTPVRWTEYAISAPIMILVIAVLCGVRDRAALISIACIIDAVIFCGPLMQYLPSKALHICFVAFVFLTVAFAQIWVSYSAYDDAPDFVSAIIFTMSLLFYSFGFVPLSAIYLNKSIRYQELIQCILSLSSKVLLTVLNVEGVRNMETS
jgi:hypothetical protein